MTDAPVTLSDLTRPAGAETPARRRIEAAEHRRQTPTCEACDGLSLVPTADGQALRPCILCNPAGFYRWCDTSKDRP